MQPIEFVALDCETTGIDSRKDNIIELGAVKFSLTKNLASFDSLFHSPTRIPQFVERLTGIQNSDLEYAPHFSAKKAEIENFLSEAILIGHNLPFDLDFLRSAGLDFSDCQTLDTFLLSGLILPRGDSLSLENLTQKFAIFHKDAHRALADAEATRELLRILIGLAKNFASEKWQQILALRAEKSWLQVFAELVLQAELAPQEIPNTSPEPTELRSEVVQKLVAEFSSEPKLIELSARPEEILAAAEKLSRPSAIFFAHNFTARSLSAAHFFAPQNYPDPAKLDKFLAKDLSPTELILAAKLILHPGKSRYELNLSRAENLLFDFVASEEMPAADAKILVGDHAALQFEKSDRLKIVADAAALPENILRENSFNLDLPNLELLAPHFSGKIQIWWGLLGLLFREAAPRFGRLDFTAATGATNFSKVVEAGQNLLAEISAFLPPRVATGLANFIDPDSNFTKSLRSSALGEITLVAEPRTLVLPDCVRDFSIDGALDAADNFSFVKKMFALPSDFSTVRISLGENLPRFLVAENLPDPATPQFFPAVAKFLLQILPQFSGRTAVVFPNRFEAGNFAERAIAELELPVFSRKIPSKQKLAELEKAVVVFSLGNFAPSAKFENCVIVKLPTRSKSDGEAWDDYYAAMILRFKKMWSDFASSEHAEKFLILDPRLFTKKYGQSLLDAIPQKFESVRISA
ncbi:MAG: exonuclease domain-containing protein [Patescibacteria group bacterium]